MKQTHKHAEVIKAWADGAKIQYRDGGAWEDVDDDVICWDVECEYRISPEKAYPETAMTDDELITSYCQSDEGASVTGYRGVANAALRHAIDSEQVVMPDCYQMMLSGEAYEKGRNDVYEESKRQRAARDLAIAEAVRDACINARYTIPGPDSVALADIIAGVRP